MINGLLSRYPALLFMLFVSLVALVACKPSEENKSTKGPSQGAVTAEACIQGLGTFNTATGLCECPLGQTWKGVQCITTVTSGTSGTIGTSSQQGCTSSGGYWSSQTMACQCPTGTYWTGATCQTNATSGTVTTQTQVTCTNAGGTWDSYNSRCECKVGEIWYQSRCQLKTSLTPQQICEGDFNRGVWDSYQRQCRCPNGINWVNERCEGVSATSSVSEQSACTGYSNNGRWDPYRMTCVCPNNLAWSPTTKLCGVTGGDAATLTRQICIQSGGTPGIAQGTCTCPSTHTIQTVSGQNVQYCIPKNMSGTGTVLGGSNTMDIINQLITVLQGLMGG